MASRPPYETRFFLVKHDLASFQAFPGRIWQVGRDKEEEPRSYRPVHRGSKWIAYAYQRIEGGRDSANLVQGFFKCTVESQFKSLPQSQALEAVGHSGEKAWVIEGRPEGRQPRSPVLLPSLSRFLGKTLFTRSSVIPIKREDYWRIHDHVLSHDEPLRTSGPFGTTPQSEQEFLLAFAESCPKIGVRRILRARTRFPDLMVVLESGKVVHVELELFSHGFLSHRHKSQVKARRFQRLPVCVVCWADDDKSVHKILPVFELRDLVSGRQSLTDVASS